MPNAMTNQEKYDQLMKDGFCVFENVLNADLLKRLRAVTDAMLNAQTEEEKTRYSSQGSLIEVIKEPIFADLIALPTALDAMASLGFDEPKFTCGFVISKPPRGPRLFWHHDWAAWDDPAAFEPLPQQLFLMYYLSDTTRENGCLRVIPGSHRKYNPLLDLLEEHSPELAAAENLDLPEFSDRPDELDVMVKAGDLLIGDARILHAAHTNQTVARRTVITLWFHPDMKSLPESTQGFIANMACPVPDKWPDEKKNLLEPLRARYDGNAQPLPWNRTRPKIPAE